MEKAPLRLGDLDPAYEQRVSRQSYGASPRIAGVQLQELRPLCDDGGSFVELGRLDERGGLLGDPEFQARQVNVSEVLPGAVKAWHLHLGQEDVWYVPPGSRLLVGLADLRVESPTRGQQMRFVLGAGKSQRLHIPRGVAHGAANPGQRPALLIYLVNQHFSARDADEWRLPWDAFGADFWAVAKG